VCWGFSLRAVVLRRVCLCWLFIMLNGSLLRVLLLWFFLSPGLLLPPVGLQVRPKANEDLSWAAAPAADEPRAERPVARVGVVKRLFVVVLPVVDKKAVQDLVILALITEVAN
jgi:hypothetical protein